MRIKRILIALFMAILCLTLGVACGKSGTVPEVKGARKITDQEAVAVYEELMQQTVEIDFKSIEIQVAEKDEAFYYSYIEECEKSGYEYQGDTVIDGMKMTALAHPNKEDTVVLVAYRNGELYVIEFVYETSGPSKMEFIWFTDAEMALFHVNLTKPTGEVEGQTHVANSKTDVTAFYDSLYLYIRNKGREQFLTFKQDLIRSGYTLGAMEDTNDYSATLVQNGVEFSAHVSYQDGMINLDIVNETQKMKVDYGRTIYDVYPSATVGIRRWEWSNNPDDKSNNGQLEKVARYTYFSYDDRYVVEFLCDETVTGDPFSDFCEWGGWISDFEERKEYGSNGASIYESEDGFRAGGWFTIKTHLYHREFTAIGSYYYNARNLQKTGQIREFAGIACAEYKGQISMNNNENVWDCTFYIWEEENIPMSYTGNRWFDDDREYTVEIAYLSQNDICEQVMGLENQSALYDYPTALVQEKSKLDFDFSVLGADGYKYNRTQQDYDSNGNTIDCTAFDAYGVSVGELQAYTAKLQNFGFDGEIYDNKCYVLYYALATGDRIKIQVSYSEQDEILCFYFVEEKFEGLNFATEGTRLVYKWNSGLGIRRGFIEFVGDDLRYGFYDSEGLYACTYYAKRNDAYFDIYNETRLGELESSSRRVLVKELWSMVNAELGATIYCDFAEDLDYVGRGYYGPDDLPTLIYKDRGGREYVLWDGYNIVLNVNESRDLELFYMEEAFESRLPTINAQFVRKSTRWHACSDYREEYIDWLFNFYKTTYDSYQEITYEGYTLEQYTQFYQSVYALTQSGWDVLSWGNYEQDETDKVWRSFNAIITNGNKRVAEITSSYDAGYENGELLYTSSYATIKEYDVSTHVNAYFGNEFNEKSFIDYTRIDGEYFTATYSEREDDEMVNEEPYMVDHVGVDLNGKVIFGDWCGLTVFGLKTVHYSAYNFGSLLLVSDASEWADVKSAKEYMALRLSYDLAEDYDLSNFTYEGNESVAGIFCKVYSGSYVERGQRLSLKVWRAEDGRNMRVEKALYQYGPYAEIRTTEITSFKEGSFSSLNSIEDINDTPLLNQKLPASAWKDEYYGFDFMPRVEGFTEFEFNGTSITFYGEEITVKAVPADTFVEQYSSYNTNYIRRLNEMHVVYYPVEYQHPTETRTYNGSVRYGLSLDRLSVGAQG